MGRYSSDSESGSERKRSSKKSKRKSKSRRRSRSSSYDAGSRSRDSRRRSRSDSRGRSRSSERSRRSRSREDRRRKRRSPSDDSHRSKRSYRRSRSRSRTPMRRRSRTRSSSRDDGYSRRRRSRSRSRERSTGKKSKKAKKRSRSRDRSSSKKEKQPSEKPRDPCENIPGFSEMPLAEQRKLRIRAAFDAVEETTTKAMEGSIFSAAAKKPIPKVETAVEQIDRALVIQDIEDDDFMPTNFSSSRSNKPKETPKAISSWPKTLAEQEDFHEMAIFGNSKALTLDENVKKEISEAAESLVKGRVKWEDRDPELLAHPSLKISKEEAERRWVDNLNEMRRKKLIEMGIMTE